MRQGGRSGNFINIPKSISCSQLPQSRCYSSQPFLMMKAHGPDECDYLIKFSKEKMGRSTIAEAVSAYLLRLHFPIILMAGN
eukprot:768473-Hanusia_phi.AAC.17